ncbi:MAG TPA: ABC transporter permease subunit [Acidothermaceae bacterium]|nr:ABC transporter permease subunit [Acidothermaceae bacterium]
MSTTMTAYRSGVPVARDTFFQLALAEFTKLRTVRGWVAGLVVGALLIVGIGYLSAVGSTGSCSPAGGASTGPASGAASGGGGCGSGTPTLGPDGEPVSDSFSFVHEQLDGDGSITVRVTSLIERAPGRGGDASSSQPVVIPWAKAGLIVKANTTQGSPYAAVMATATHGVRMQYNFTKDIAGSARTVSKTSPQWLRLSRSGDTLTGYESADGQNWTKLGVAKLSGLPASVPVGLFVTSPDDDVTTEEIVGTSTQGGPSLATATFDEVSLPGGQPPGSWQGAQVGDNGLGNVPPFTRSGGTFTVSGSGDIGPMASSGGDNNTVSGSLVGAFVGLMAMVVIGALFITSEYRRGLIRTTFTASPRRGRVLAAKAVVLACVVFVLSLAASAFSMWFVDRQRRNNGTYISPASAVTEMRVLVGTAAVLAIAAVLAVAIGTIVRRSATAVAAVIALIVLPYILGVSSIGALQWMLRVTPAAGFAVQQTLHQYPQVSGVYIASAGYYPLSPSAGFGVLIAWMAVALGVAFVLLRKRDA